MGEGKTLAALALSALVVILLVYPLEEKSPHYCGSKAHLGFDWWGRSSSSERMTLALADRVSVDLPQIDTLVLVRRNPGANLRRRLAQLGHTVGVHALLRAGAALHTVRAGEATEQARMAQCTVAAAVAGQLIQHPWNPGGQRIDLILPGERSARSA